MPEFVAKFKNGLVTTHGLVRDLPDFFRGRITVERAREEIKRALDQREERFLQLVRTRIYDKPQSVYLKLFKIAGCDFSDLESDVHRHGLEKTLERLASAGVYLTSDEFKGKTEVVRGNRSFRVFADDFQRDDTPSGFVGESSGTNNRPIRSVRALDWLAIRTFGMCIFFFAHDLFSYSHAVYDAVLPASGGVGSLLHYAKLGIGVDKWFARKVPADSRMDHAYHYLTTYLIVLMGKYFGPGFPRPEFLDIDDVERIVRWIAEKNRRGKACCINAAASNAARIARLAREMGISLEGTKFRVHGEPFTEAKREVLEHVGAKAIPHYSGGMSFGGGYGCANPLYSDEVHASHYNVALIRQVKSLTKDGPPIYPLLFTTLYPSAPRLAINVESGDYATMERRDCGCALEQAGLTLHLHHIRSFEKFTSEGMNYFYGDLYEFFEKTLPSEFGGGPGDYQLVEEEDKNGQTRLTLRAHPQTGALDEQKLLARLREELGRRSWSHEFQTRIWERAGTLRVRREAPFVSSRGKILPLQIQKRSD